MYTEREASDGGAPNRQEPEFSEMDAERYARHLMLEDRKSVV